MAIAYPSLSIERGTSQDIHKVRIAITFGATSTVSSYIGQGVTATKTDTGKWDITLPMPYANLVSLEYGWKNATAATPLHVHVTSIASIASTTAPAVSIETVIQDGTVTHPASGAVLYLTLGLSSDSSAAVYSG